MDATGMKSESRPLYGLAPTKKYARVLASKAEPYEPRVDLLRYVSYDKLLVCETKTTIERKKAGVKGYTKIQTKEFIRKKVAPEVKKIPMGIIFVIDKGLRFKPEEVKEELVKGGANNIEDVWIIATGAGNLVHPLENAMWHEMKDRVRSRNAISEKHTAKFMKEEFMKTSKDDIYNYFRHCVLTFLSDLYNGLEDN